MATYYVSKISGTIRYKSGAWPSAVDTSAASISAILTAVGAGHTIVLDVGNWSGAALGATGLLSMGANNQTLRKPIPTDPDYSNHAGIVEIDGTSTTATVILSGGGRSGAVIKGLTVCNAQAGTDGANAYGSVTFDSCVFKNHARRHITTIALEATSVTLIKNCYFIGGLTSDATELFAPAGTGTAYIENNIFIPGDKEYGPAVSVQGTGTYYVRNNLFVATKYGIFGIFGTPASGTVTVSGNRVIGSGCINLSSGSGIGFIAAQTSTANNNALSVSAVAPTTPITGADTANDNIFSADPYYVQSGRTGYFVASLDDAVSTTFDVLYGSDGTNGLVAEANAAGVGVTWYCDSARMASITDDVLWARDNGVEIGAHTRTHSDITASGAIFTVAPGTVTIDRAANTITYSAGGTVTGFRSKTLAAIKTELEGFGATVTGSAIYNISAVTTIQGACLGEAIANASASSSINILVGDAMQGYVFSEVSGCIDEIEAITGTIVRSFAYPFGAKNATVEGIIRQIKGGQITSARYTSIDTASSQHIASLNRYAIGAFNVPDVKANTTSGDGTADIKANINGLMAYLAETGSVASTFAHGVGEISVAQWKIIIDEVVKWQGKVVSATMGDAINAIMDFATDDGDGTLSYTWPEGVGDYRLLAQSACIGAGVDVGLTTDIDGNDIPGAVGYDIGPYSYMPGWAVSDGVLPVDGQVFKSHTAPIAAKKITVFPGVASAGQIQEATE